MQTTMKTTKLVLAVALVPFGCGQGPQNPPPVAGASPATASAPAAQPAPPSRAPSTSAPSGSSSAPASAPAGRVRLVVPAGTELPIELETTVSSDSSHVGDTVLATLSESVALTGFTLDKGAEVRGEVVTVVPAKRVKGRARIVIDFDTVMENGEKLSINTTAIDASAKSSKSKDTKVIAGGAIGGLILGAIKDGKKGAAIGTAAGAAAGTGAVLIMKGDEVELPRGTKLTVEVR